MSNKRSKLPSSKSLLRLQKKRSASLMTQSSLSNYSCAERANSIIKCRIIPSFKNMNDKSLQCSKPSKILVSQELMRKIESMRKQIEIKKKCIETSKQKTQIYRQQIIRYQDTLTNRQFLSASNFITSYSSSSHILRNYRNRTNDRLSEKAKLEKSISKGSDLKNELTKETQENDHLNRSIVTESYCENTLFIANRILGEQTKGLYLLDKNFSVPNIIEVDPNLMKFENNSISQLSVALPHTDILLSQTFQLINFKKEVYASFLDLKFSMKHMVHSLSCKKSEVVKETRNIRSKHEALEKRSLSLQMSYKQLIKKSSFQDLILCENCNALYEDSENFEWSCRRHLSPWTGQYFCCGSSDVYSKGCSYTKHTSQQKHVKQTLACISCHAQGHNYKVCPKDPNNVHSFQKKKIKNCQYLNNKSLIHFLSQKQGLCRKQTISTNASSSVEKASSFIIRSNSEEH